MIIDYDTKPEKNLYLIGYQVLNIFNDLSINKIDVKVLYYKYVDATKSKISFNYFLYALDWLYLLDLIEVSKNAEIKKCY